MTEIKCNGLYLPALHEKRIIRDDERIGLYADINRQRAVFRIDCADANWGSGGKFVAGNRFLSNEAVIDRIQSACPFRAHFEAFRDKWILAALRDCASADHWYLYEKDWDWPVVQDEPDPEEAIQE